MRIMTAVLVSAAVAVLASCGRGYADAVKYTGATTVLGTAPTLPAACVPLPGDANACRNMLPGGWMTNAQQTAQVVSAIPVFSNPIVEQKRVAGQECRSASPGPAKVATLTYNVPTAMDEFPPGGTNNQDLVVAVFSSQANIGPCWESRYNVMNVRGNPNAALYFVTVRTGQAASANSGVDRVIGEWRSWVVYQQGPAWKLDSLGRGAYVQCGTEHDSSVGEFAFISCGAAARAHMKAREYANRDSAFHSIISIVRAGTDSTLLAALGANPTSDPAWARCGALGCCGSY